MGLFNTDLSDREHRIRWTPEGGFCDAGEDCPICAAEEEDEEDEDE